MRETIGRTVLAVVSVLLLVGGPAAAQQPGEIDQDVMYDDQALFGDDYYGGSFDDEGAFDDDWYFDYYDTEAEDWYGEDWYDDHWWESDLTYSGAFNEENLDDDWFFDEYERGHYGFFGYDDAGEEGLLDF